MSKERKLLTLEEILHSSSPYEVYIESLDRTVKVRNTSTKDRQEAERLAMTHPAWSLMTLEDKSQEIGRMLVLLMLVEPKITYDQYMSSDDATMQLILDTIATEYRLKIMKLQEQRGANMRRFLQALTESNPESSMNSLNSETSIGKEQP